MSDMYSTYEAKAKLSEILRKVERGRIVRISRRGKPIAEIRPLRRERGTLEERISELEERGVVTLSSGGTASYRPLARRPGALRRFLADRDG
jgi:prevent-host-death family protein